MHECKHNCKHNCKHTCTHNCTHNCTHKYTRTPVDPTYRALGGAKVQPAFHAIAQNNPSSTASTKP